MIGGIWKKRNGRLLYDGLARRQHELAQSGERLVRKIEFQGSAT